MGFKSIINFLKKIGLLRMTSGSFSGKNKYDNYEFMEAKDYKGDKEEAKKKNKDLEDKSIKKTGRKVLYYVSWVVFALLLLIYTSNGAMFLSFILVLIWMILIAYIKRYVNGQYSPKKIIASFLSITFISLILLSYVGEDTSWKRYSDMSFTTNFEWTEDLSANYTEQETDLEMAYSGPFYFGSFDGLDEYSKMYSLARGQRVEKIVEVMDETIGYLNELELSVKEERGIMDWYIFKIATLDPSTKDAILPFIDKSTEYAFEQNLSLEFLNTLKEELEDMDRNAEWGFLTYTKFIAIQDLIKSYDNEIQDMHSKLATLYYYLESDNDLYKAINDELDYKIQHYSENISEYSQKAFFNMQSLLLEEKLLVTADYYFAQDAIAHVQAKSLDLEKAIDLYNGSKLVLDDDTINFMRESNNAFKELANGWKEYLDSIPKENLLNESFLSFEETDIPTAYAIGNPFTWLGSTVKSVAKGGWNISKAGASYAWDKTKAATVAVKNVAISGVKTVGKTIGVGLDIASATTMTGYGLFFSDSWANWADSAKDNYKKVWSNFKEGKSGSQVYGDALKGMDKLENISEKIVSTVIEKTLGTGVTSKTMGFAAKTVVGFFTGLAKDSYVVLDPSTSEADTLKALGSLAMTVAGGSQSVMKGSQSLKIIGTGSKSLAKKSLAIIAKASPKTAIKTLKSLVTKKGLINFGKSSFKIAEKTSKGSLNIAKKGYKFFKGNIKDGVPSTVKDLFKKQPIQNVFKTALGMGEEGLVKNSIGLLNNIIGATVDNYPSIFEELSKEYSIEVDTFKNLYKYEEGVKEPIKKTPIKKVSTPIVETSTKNTDPEPKEDYYNESEEEYWADDSDNEEDYSESEDNMFGDFDFTIMEKSMKCLNDGGYPDENGSELAGGWDAPGGGCNYPGDELDNFDSNSGMPDCSYCVNADDPNQCNLDCYTY